MIFDKLHEYPEEGKVLGQVKVGKGITILKKFRAIL